MRTAKKRWLKFFGSDCLRHSDKKITTYNLKDGRSYKIIDELTIDRDNNSFVCLAEVNSVIVIRDEEYKVPFKLACELYKLPEYGSDVFILIQNYFL